MEFVALSDTVLNVLAREDRLLRISFRGVFPADKLPPVAKERQFSDAYIVNKDPAGEPGEHSLAIWTRSGVCEVFDGYGLPLSTYKNPKLQAWLAQWKEMVSSDLTLQAIDSQTCGHYALMDSLETGNFGENGDCSEIGNFGKNRQKCMQWRKWQKSASLWQFQLDAKSGPLEAGEFGEIQNVAKYSNWMPKVAPSK